MLSFAEPRRQKHAALANSVLQLALAAAQEREGSTWLGKPQFFAVLRAVGHWILSPEGEGIFDNVFTSTLPVSGTASRHYCSGFGLLKAEIFCEGDAYDTEIEKGLLSHPNGNEPLHQAVWLCCHAPIAIIC